MEELDLMEFIRCYLSKIYIVIVSVAVALIIGNVYANFIRVPLYQSSTTVILVNKEEDKNNYSQSDLYLSQGLVPTYSEIIRSKKVMRQVIWKEDLDYSAEQLMDMVNVSSVNETEIIKITVTNKDASKAAAIANAIVPAFSKEVESIYELDNVSVIDSAEKASKPYNVNFVKDNIIYLLIGAVFGSFIIFLIYYFDNSIKSSTVIEEKYGLTVLGVIPVIGRR